MPYNNFEWWTIRIAYGIAIYATIIFVWWLCVSFLPEFVLRGLVVGLVLHFINKLYNLRRP